MRAVILWIKLLIGIHILSIKGTQVSLFLKHVVPARSALRTSRLDDSSSKRPSLKDKYFDLHLLDNVSERINVQSKGDYIFKVGTEVPFLERSEYLPYFERLPAILPDPTDHETIFSFAKMAANSYLNRSMEGWRNSTNYRDEDGFGWNSNGLRGHVFVNELQTIVVISFKGTSTILHGGETVARDKYMDNIMFSCCCARVDMTWTPVCGCYQGSEQGRSLCGDKCLKDTIRSDEESYYREALAITDLIKLRYPRAQLWFTGHSLGGAIAALMAIRHPRTAAVTFSSPGPYLYSRHLGLDQDAPGTQWRYPIWNFGLSSDPIFIGTCTGLVTSCYLSGYAMETSCRHGMDCLFNINAWQPDVATHRIDWFIDHVLTKPKKYALPVCVPNRNCTDCIKWSFV